MRSITISLPAAHGEGEARRYPVAPRGSDPARFQGSFGVLLMLTNHGNGQIATRNSTDRETPRSGEEDRGVDSPLAQTLYGVI